MWFVASIPFWLMGLWCLWAAADSLAIKRPDETQHQQVEQMFVNLCGAGLAFCFAARIAS